MTRARSSFDLLALTGLVLREPKRVLEHAAPERLLPSLLTLVIAGAGLFGLVVGSYRGGLQHLWAAIKLPMVLLLPLLVALPACVALYRVAGVAVRHGQVVLAAVLGTARASLLLAAMTPALWLAYSIALPYHDAVLLMCGALVVAGGIGLSTTASLLPGGGHLRTAAHLGSLAIAAVVLAQGGWLLRPFLVRPRGEITFVRAPEADVFSSVAASYRSAKGDYRGWDAEPVPLWRGGDAPQQEAP
ncbi:MAG: hypothetical protein K1X88_33295 [Nannocystaceae bacterium]|nr:hypothetical protein [Nannocystaceae bacterium]